MNSQEAQQDMLNNVSELKIQVKWNKGISDNYSINVSKIKLTVC